MKVKDLKELVGGLDDNTEVVFNTDGQLWGIRSVHSSFFTSFGDTTEINLSAYDKDYEDYGPNDVSGVIWQRSRMKRS